MIAYKTFSAKASCAQSGMALMFIEEPQLAAKVLFCVIMFAYDAIADIDELCKEVKVLQKGNVKESSYIRHHGGHDRGDGTALVCANGRGVDHTKHAFLAVTRCATVEECRVRIVNNLSDYEVADMSINNYRCRGNSTHR